MEYRATLVSPPHREWPEEGCYQDIGDATDAFNDIVEICERKKAKSYEVRLEKVDYDPFSGSVLVIDVIKWKLKN